MRMMRLLFYVDVPCAHAAGAQGFINPHREQVQGEPCAIDA